MTADMVEKPESKVVRRVIAVDEAHPVVLRKSPELITTILSRVEPRTDLPISARTTVQNHPEAKTLPRFDPPRVALPLGIGLLESRRTISRGAQGDLQRKTDAEIRTRAHRSSIQARLKGSGAPLAAGQTHLFRLPSKGVSKELSAAKRRPSIFIEGNQAVRVTFLDGVGAPIQDWEFGPSSSAREIACPPGTKGFTTMGLGGAHQLGSNLDAGAGTITSRFSTGNRSGVGFLAHNLLIQSGPINYLCRGGDLEVRGIPMGSPQRMDKSLVLARNALKHSTGFRVTLPASIQTLALIVRGEGSVEGSCRVRASEHFLLDAGTIALGESRWIHLFTVDLNQSASKDTLPINVTLGEGWACDGAVGLQGTPSTWSTQLGDGRWRGLIETGPLSSDGSTSVTWRDTEEPLIGQAVSVESFKFKPRTVKAKQPSTKSLETPSSLPRLALPPATIGQPYAHDISKLAFDADGDALTFHNIAGDEWLVIGADSGIIQGTPGESDGDAGEIMVRVEDMSGEYSDALFIVPIDRSNTPPVWRLDEEGGVGE
jgi:hypothetical protein